MTVSWFDGAIDNPSPASDEKVQKAERELGVRLPADFLAIAKTHQGAMPEPECFDLPKGGRGSIKYLLHFEEEPFYSNIVSRGEPVRDVLPEKVIPFAEDGGGNLLCFDYRNSDETPEILFWHHEGNMPFPLQTIASSFTDLIERLRD
jgi:cell wall assembly regulator SMI1